MGCPLNQLSRPVPRTGTVDSVCTGRKASLSSFGSRGEADSAAIGGWLNCSAPTPPVRVVDPSVASASTRPATVATAARPLPILRFADAKRSTLEVGAVQRLHGTGCVGIRHLYEAEAAWATGVAIGDQGDLLDGSMRGKQRANGLIGGGEGKISDI
jgi:hypothetical protein